MKEFSLAKKFNWELANQPIKDQVLPIIIPTPTIKIVGTDNHPYGDPPILGANPLLLASYLPYSDSQSETFKKYNPKFYLFRYKSAHQSRKRNSIGDVIKMNKAKAFVHPTHMNGINFPANTPIYGGNTRTPMHTEFDLGNINPYEYSTLGFVPYDFVEVPGTVTAWIPMTSADWGLPPISYRFTGKKQNARSILFKIAIGIDNPTGSKTNPILFGDFSDTFRLQLLAGGNTTYHFTMQLQLSSVVRKVITP